MNRRPVPSISRRLISSGFRLFFPGSSLVAAMVVALWVPWFLGFIHVPTSLPPLAWHQHELLFGFVPAVIAGFLLTAVPNWTGRPGLAGWPLLALFVLWLAGRVAISVSEWTGPGLAMVITLAFLPLLAALIMRELVAAKNRRNYKIVGVLLILFCAQVLFYFELEQYGRIEIADRMALAAIIFLIAIVAGRIIPAFTGNWLKANNPGRLPVAFSRFDLSVMAITGAGLLLWVGAPFWPRILALSSGALMIVAGLGHLARQARWCPERTFGETLVAILHVAYLFVPVGFIFIGTSLLLDDAGLRSAGVHAWTTGAVGIMALAVMTRATRGHTGQALHAPWTTTWLIYCPIMIATVARIAVPLTPAQTMSLLPLAGLAWIVSFLGYGVFYLPLIMRKGV